VKDFLQYFILFFLCVCSPQVFADTVSERICVLNFMPKGGQRYNHGIDSVFKGHGDIILKENAIPTDLLDCASRDSVEEIVLIAHSTPSQVSAETDDLVWYRELASDERASFLEQYMNNPNIPARLQKKASSYVEHPEKAITLPRRFLPFTFDKLLSTLEREFNGGNLKLKTIRIATCETGRVLSRYPQIQNIADRFGIRIDIEPPNKLLSWLFAKGVVSLNKKWLRKSFNEEL
jgi:hypothetical protein